MAKARLHKIAGQTELVSTEQALVRAATNCFAVSGYDATSIQDIATKAGISKGIFYHYFSSKDQILRRIVTEMLDDLSRAYGAVLEAQTSVSEKISTFVHTMVTSVATHPEETAIFVQERRIFARSFADLNELSDRVVTQLEELLRAGMRDGSVRELVSPHAMSLGLIGMATWVYQWAEGSTTGGDDVANMYSAVVLNGLCVNRPPRPKAQWHAPRIDDQHALAATGGSNGSSTRAALIKAAMSAFVDSGYSGTSINTIAKGAGVTTGAVYSQFSGKSAILHAIMSRFLVRLSQAMDDALLKRLSLPDTLARFISSLFGEVDDHQTELTIFLQEFRHLAGDDFKDLRMKSADIQGKIGAVLSAGVQEKEFRAIGAGDGMAAGLLGMCSFPFQWKDPEEAIPTEAADMFAEVILGGLMPRRTRRPA